MTFLSYIRDQLLSAIRYRQAILDADKSSLSEWRYNSLKKDLSDMYSTCQVILRRHGTDDEKITEIRLLIRRMNVEGVGLA